jgi:3-hydroxypropionyl-coenzyme A dehydratase
MTPVEAENYAIHVHRLLNMIENFEVPVIAAINGYAIGGGCQLALACDIRYATKNAKIGQTEVTIGIPPGWGATQRLARIVGISKAKELIYTGKLISANEAKRIGLINEIIEPETNQLNVSSIENQEKISNQFFIDKCILFSELISRNNTLPLKIAKTLINKARDVDIDSGLLMERYASSLCFVNTVLEKWKNKFS